MDFFYIDIIDNICMCIYFFFAVLKYLSWNELIYLLVGQISKEAIHTCKSASKGSKGFIMNKNKVG